MSLVLLAPRAERDLEKIARYISVDNLTAALRVIEALHATFQFLSHHPGCGRSEARLAPGLCVFPGLRPAQRYVILYRVCSEGIEIAGVVHGSQNWQASRSESTEVDES